MCRVPSCKTRVIGRELGLHEPQIPAREQHLPRLPHLQRGHQHTAILLASPEPFGWWAMSYPLIEGSNGAPTSRSYVYRSGNAGSPMGRESYGDGVSIVVSGRESRLQGEGRQVAVTQRSKRARCVQAETPREADHWRAGCDRKTHARFGKGPKEKGQKWYLVGGLLHSLSGSRERGGETYSPEGGPGAPPRLHLSHDVLVNILAEKIHDGRFLRLISELLKAGYLEEWTFNATLSGVPQGGDAHSSLHPRKPTQGSSRVQALEQAYVGPGQGGPQAGSQGAAMYRAAPACTRPTGPGLPTPALREIRG